MLKSQLLDFAMPSQIAPILRRIECGDHNYQSFILEGLQDRGLIDHSDKLTDKGREMIARGKVT